MGAALIFNKRCRALFSNFVKRPLAKIGKNDGFNVKFGKIKRLFFCLMLMFIVTFFFKSFWNTIKASNRLDPYQAQQDVGCDLGQTV